MSAPISRSVVMSPVRNGLVMTSARITSEPGTMRAATSGKAADEGSAGTMTAAGVNSGSPRNVIRRPAAPSASTRTSAPKCASRCSVWSRLASLSITTVSPGAARPASRTADLICAEGTGVR